MDEHTHTSYFTERFATIKFRQGKNSSKGFNFNKKWRKKPQKVHIVTSIEGDDERAQYASFKHTFI